MTIKCDNCEKEYADELKGTYCPDCGYLIGTELHRKDFTDIHPVLSHFGLVCLIAVVLTPFFVLLAALADTWRVFWGFPVAVGIIEAIILGLELESSREKRSPPPWDRMMRHRFGITIGAVALAATAVSAALVYVDPQLTWNPALRDSDGDGVHDPEDLYPLDQGVWDNASATVKVTVINLYGSDLYYDIWIADTHDQMSLPIAGPVADGGWDERSLVWSWPIGELNMTHILITVRGYEPDTPHHVPIVSNATYVTLNPNDEAEVPFVLET